MRSETAVAIRLEDYAPAPYRISKLFLDVKLAPQATVVTAELHIERGNATKAGTPLELDGDGLELEGVQIDGFPADPAAITATPDKLVLHSPPADPFVLTIRTRVNPEANTQLMGLYRSSGTYCTQCEAEGFRRITYFLDRPDILSVYTTRIEARKSDAPILLGNGNPSEAGDIPGTDRHYAIWHDPFPKPSYLFALVGGDLAAVRDTFTTSSGRSVDLAIYVEHGRENWCDWAMDSLKRSMRWDEETFGLEYDLDVFNIVAVSDFNMGAMENKGLNIFNDKYVLADPQTATDQDYANVEAVIAHEYFHNWTGNRITCRDWFQLCLKEGLTVFRDQEFSSDMRSRPVKRISDVRLLKAHQFPEDAGPLAHPVRPRTYREINNFYTATVYEKGAEVVRMLKTLLGPDSFRAGMDLYFQRHDGEATTIEAFLACFAEAAGTDLDQFALWYEQAGTPLIKVDCTYSEENQELRLTLSQSIPPLPGQDETDPNVIPVRFGLLGEDGKDMDLVPTPASDVSGDMMVLKQRTQTFTLQNVQARPVLSLLRRFSAPVRLDFDQSKQDLLFLAQRDSDPFNRWQATQTLATRELIRLAGDARQDKALLPDVKLVDAFGETISDTTLDPAFRAQTLDLPSEADIARDLGKDVDPDAIHAARQALRKAIGLQHHSALIGAAQLDGEAFSPDAAAAGQRAFANRALSLLAVADEPGTAELLKTRFDMATNMTDRISALLMLVHNGLHGSEAALAAFLNRFQDTSLAMDKWFMVQATAPKEDAFDRITALTAHPLFDKTNPNRLRSLVQSFATGNPTQFSHASGRGFDFVADMVLEIDNRNPQVASRLLTSFRSWRALEENRAALAKQALLRISAEDDLSRDTRDIVDRCLQ
ncbi:aminopeptidase N [Roseibium hamelinense]|uniref:Aminopeptidase N n=1 Tax=Roseibium hamelinense TaxID=150831 RepID=A0A562T8Y0_9HYPH|nr:aminopeptidase N [Roseibium hamelinense]MTI43732.1 aminopeptidase N [Roseibium hamelinense]TWI89416.1 aminopeptidase N [Roseibium hamelinense]